jgi:hypothetical protein
VEQAHRRDVARNGSPSPRKRRALRVTLTLLSESVTFVI